MKKAINILVTMLLKDIKELQVNNADALPDIKWFIDDNKFVLSTNNKCEVELSEIYKYLDNLTTEADCNTRSNQLVIATLTAIKELTE